MPKEPLTLDHVMSLRGMTGRQLAFAADLPESTVSRFRNGLEPSDAMKERLGQALMLTKAEWKALGWKA